MKQICFHPIQNQNLLMSINVILIKELKMLDIHQTNHKLNQYKSLNNQPANTTTTLSKSMIYNQSELLQDINESALKEQMHVLKQEMKHITMQYRESYERGSLIMLYQ